MSHACVHTKLLWAYRELCRFAAVGRRGGSSGYSTPHSITPNGEVTDKASGVQ